MAVVRAVAHVQLNVVELLLVGRKLLEGVRYFVFALLSLIDLHQSESDVTIRCLIDDVAAHFLQRAVYLGAVCTFMHLNDDLIGNAVWRRISSLSGCIWRAAGQKNAESQESYCAS